MDLEQIIREYIEKTLHMSLATVSGDRPWVCEVHFAYDQNLNLYFRSYTKTRHSQELLANPNVAGNIVAQHAIDQPPHGIYFEGTAEVVTDESVFEELYGYFMQRQAVDENIIEDAINPEGKRFHKITVQNWYAFGKFTGDKTMKHTLTWNGGSK